MRKNIERTAWMILIASFLTFCALAIGIPLSIRAYLFNTMQTHTTTLTSIRGTVLEKPSDDQTPIPITSGASRDVKELTIISTDDTSQAILTFFDGSVATLYNGTTIILHRAREPRFNVSPYPAELGLEVVQGRVRATIAPSDTARTFWIRTPHGKVAMTAGSFAVEAHNEETQITARAGTATVTAQEASVILHEGELTRIPVNAPPTEPSTAEQNLIVNGDFSAGLNEVWQPQVYVPADPLTGTQKAITTAYKDSVSKFDPVNVVTSTLAVENINGQMVTHFHSAGTNNVHTEASIEQIVNKDVQDFRSLRVNAQIRVNSQSLPGGGQLGTEFPVMIQLNFRDAQGNDRSWYRGFYYKPAPSNYILHSEPDNNNESVAQFLWYPYESENLLQDLGDEKPVFIKSIRIYASGWIYDSMVTDIKLLAED